MTLGMYAIKVLKKINILEKKLFNPLKFIGFLFFNIFMTLTITFSIVFIILYSSVTSLSNGYLTLATPSLWNAITKFEIIPKVKLVEKIYTKKTNSVHIVGLFDMGREELYRELISKYNDKDSVLLKDAITDTDNRLNVSPGLQNIFREIGILKNRNENTLEVTIAESNLDVSEFNTITTDTFRNLLALFEPENFKIFFKRLIFIVENILKYIKSTASDFYSLKETGIGQNYNELQNILKDDHSWQICAEDIRKISSKKNSLLLENTLNLESDYKNIIIIGGNTEFEKDLEKSGYTLRHKTRHPFPYTTYKEYFRERINIIVTLTKEIYNFIKTNTWDEFVKIFRR